jgi:hypothetical protein
MIFEVGIFDVVATSMGGSGDRLHKWTLAGVANRNKPPPRQSDESGTGRDESADGWDESAARASVSGLEQGRAGG